MTVHHPGDVLGRRYELAELLVDASPGRAWLGKDKVLGRAVGIHELPASSPRAEKLRNAARAASLATDPRLLRVLDFDEHEDAEGTTLYVVSEWGAGLTLGHALANGPFTPERAARMGEHIARAIGHAHSAGVTHGRLVPENVLVDEAGEVRIIGTAIEAALLGLPRATVAQDTTDVTGLLYAALTGRWSGRSESSLPRAPRGPDRAFLRVRQVRAGVPPVLDEAVWAMNRPDASLGELQAALATWLGVHVEAHAGDVTVDTALNLRPFDENAQPAVAVAPEPRSVRRDPPMPLTIAPAPGELDHERLPGNRWLQVAIAAAMVVFLAVGAVFAFQLGREGHTGRPTGTASAVPLTFTARDFDPQGSPPAENGAEVRLAYDKNVATAWHTSGYLQQFGPKGLKYGVGLLLDLGRTADVASVALTTVGAPTGGAVYVLPSAPALAPSSLTTGSPTLIDGIAPAGAATGGPTGTIALPAGTRGRYVVIWLTSLPAVSGGYQGGIAEVSVSGTPSS